MSKWSDAFDGEEEAYAPSAFEHMKKGPEEEGDDAEELDTNKMNAGHYAAAQEMMDAHSRNDHKAYANAMKSFMDCCK